MLWPVQQSGAADVILTLGLLSKQHIGHTPVSLHKDIYSQQSNIKPGYCLGELHWLQISSQRNLGIDMKDPCVNNVKKSEMAKTLVDMTDYDIGKSNIFTSI